MLILLKAVSATVGLDKQFAMQVIGIGMEQAYAYTMPFQVRLSVSA